MAREDNPNIMSNSETRKVSLHRRPPKHKYTLRREIAERRKSKRTPKKRNPYEPHQSGMEVQVNATTEMMTKTMVDINNEFKTVDFEDVTHPVTLGEFESIEGFKISEDDSRMTLRLIKNRNGHKMKPAQTRTLLKTGVDELDSYDMIASI